MTQEPIILDVLDDLSTGTTAQRFDGVRYGVDVSFFLNHTEPGRTISLHEHLYPEVLVVQDGEATITVDGAQIAARSGLVVVVPAGARHGFTSTGDRPLEMVSIHPVAEMKTIGRDDPQSPGPS